MEKDINIIISGERDAYTVNNISFQHNNNSLYTVVEYGDKQDISVFTDKEWKDFNEILREFSLRQSWLASDSDYSYSHTPKDYLNAVYFIKYCEIDFDNIEVKEYLDGNDVYDILQKIGYHDRCSVNVIRDWIYTNYDTILENYRRLNE